MIRMDNLGKVPTFKIHIVRTRTVLRSKKNVEWVSTALIGMGILYPIIDQNIKVHLVFLHYHLVLSSPPDVSADVYLFLSDLLVGHQVIELFHGPLYDVTDCEGDLHLLHQPLVPGQSVPEGAAGVTSYFFLLQSPSAHCSGVGDILQMFAFILYQASRKERQ